MKLQRQKLQNTEKQAKLGVDAKKSELDIATNAIRKTLGLNENQQFELVDRDYTYEKVEEIGDIVAHANVAANTSLKVESLQDTLELAEKNEKIYLADGTPSAESYEEKKAAINKASRDIADAKTSIRTSVIDTYNNLKVLEQSIELSEKAYQEALMDYKTAEINYNLGNITKLTLDKAALAVDNAEMQHDLNLRNYSLLKYRFEHPSLLDQAS